MTIAPEIESLKKEVLDLKVKNEGIISRFDSEFDFIKTIFQDLTSHISTTKNEILDHLKKIQSFISFIDSMLRLYSIERNESNVHIDKEYLDSFNDISRKIESIRLDTQNFANQISRVHLIRKSFAYLLKSEDMRLFEQKAKMDMIGDVLKSWQTNSLNIRQNFDALRKSVAELLEPYEALKKVIDQFGDGDTRFLSEIDSEEIALLSDEEYEKTKISDVMNFRKIFFP